MLEGGFLHPEKILLGLNIIKPGMRIADFGCGSGYFSLPLAKMAGAKGEVSAIDVLPGVLDAVRSKAKTLGVFNIKTVRANLEVTGSSGLEDSSQDIVVLANVLFQSKKKDAILKEAVRVLKPEGQLVVIEWDLRSILGPPKSLRVDPGEVKQLARGAGLVSGNDFEANVYHYGILFTKEPSRPKI